MNLLDLENSLALTKNNELLKKWLSCIIKSNTS